MSEQKNEAKPDAQVAPTPETDEVEQAAPDGVIKNYVPSDFARTLERQRDEARAERDESRKYAEKLKVSINGIGPKEVDYIIAVSKERDTTVASLATAQAQVEQLRADNKRILRLIGEVNPGSAVWHIKNILNESDPAPSGASSTISQTQRHLFPNSPTPQHTSCLTCGAPVDTSTIFCFDFIEQTQNQPT